MSALKLWLAFKLFGSGYGLAAPFHPQAFYWCDGEFYTWIFGFGAQLRSFEWMAPIAGTERRLFGRTFRVFQAHRTWLLVEISWAVCEELTDAGSIRKLKEILP